LPGDAEGVAKTAQQGTIDWKLPGFMRKRKRGFVGII